jgi:hypothetical protein
MLCCICIDLIARTCTASSIEDIRYDDDCIVFSIDFSCGIQSMVY